MKVTIEMVSEQVVGILVLLLLGYFMNRKRILPKETENILAQLSTKLFAPALLISIFLENCTMENLHMYSELYIEKVYRYALSFPNYGGFGTPIVLALFGANVFFQYQLFLLPMQICVYSWGIVQLMPKTDLRSILKNFCNPVFVSTLLGMVLGVSGIKEYLPELVPNTLQNLGNCYTVVTLLLTGFVIGNYGLKELVGNQMFYVIAFFRLLVLPGVLLIVLRLLHVPEILLVLTCLVYACPCGMNIVVYPAAYGQDTRSGASLVIMTSTLAVFTIPLLYVIT